jgi:chlorite dismutase
LDAEAPDDMTAHVVRGAVRGETGAVVGFADYEFAVTPAQVLFRFVDVVEFLPHDTADAHLAELRGELAARAQEAR